MRRRFAHARTLAVALALGGVGAALAGCARTMIAERARTDYAPADGMAEMDFWYALPGRIAVSNDEALHALVLLEDSGHMPRGYAERVAHAKARGWVPESWDEPAEAAVQRGTLARAIVRVCGIKGGVIMRVFGPVPRYALRELVYLGIMPSSTENQTISGLDFLGVVSKAQDYITLSREREAAPEPAGVPPGPPPAGPSRTG